MLIRFAVSNFRSVKERAELSMVAERNDPASSTYQPSVAVNLVAESALYGPNASGKSNLLFSLQWLSYAVSSSLRFWEDAIPVEPFAFTDTVDHPTSFELDMVVNATHYEYYLDLDQEKIQYESVYATDSSGRRCLFERTYETVVFDETIKRQTAIRELLTPRTLVLSIVVRYAVPVLSDLTDSILDMQFLGSLTDQYQSMPLSSALQTQLLFDEDALRQQPLFEDKHAFSANPERRDRALAWLRMADLGIRDVRVIKDQAKSHGRNKVQLLHATQRGESALEFSQESEGTRSWFRLIGPVLAALERGSVLVFDELDASLHPVLSAQLLKFFRDPSINGNGAQLLFSAHDTGLMQYLNSDEIWITEKHDGATSVHSLASFDSERVRNSTNLEAGYLNGRFGGLPNLDLTQFLRSKGVMA